MSVALARLAGGLLAASLLACAGRGAVGARAPRNELSQARMVDDGYHSVFDAVEALRGNWLRARGVDSFARPGQVIVYFDEARLGGVDTMRSIPPQAVAFARFYDAVAASARWGPGHTQGVIYLSSGP